MDWKDPEKLRTRGRYVPAGLPLDIAELFAEAYAARVRIHCNAWERGDPGTYGDSEQLDKFVWYHKDFCVLVAAGNAAHDRNGDGSVTPYTVTPPGTAKNCITVGACESRRPEFDHVTYGRWWPSDFPKPPFNNNRVADNPNKVVAFSGRGKTEQGSRWKPDVVAPGTFILSTRSAMISWDLKPWEAYPDSPRYCYMGGTSQATALAAGAVALLREHLRVNIGIDEPTAALLKAALIVGAVRLDGYASQDSPVVDEHQGFGRVSLGAVVAPQPPVTVRFHDELTGLGSGEYRRFPIEVESDRHALRVVLAYTDYPGAKLQNSVNLLLTDPKRRTYWGNQRHNSDASDINNNVEVIEIPKPPRGTWEVTVVTVNISYPPQDFALVYRGHLAPA
jgi:serine protease AprX